MVHDYHFNYTKQEQLLIFRQEDQLHFNICVIHLDIIVQAFHSCLFKKVIVDSTNIFSRQ